MAFVQIATRPRNDQLTKRLALQERVQREQGRLSSCKFAVLHSNLLDFESILLSRNLAKSTILDSQAEAKNGLENDTLDEPWAYTEEWVLKVGGGGQPRSEYNYEVSEGRHNIEIGEDGKVDTNTTDPGSDEDWTHWMSKEQIRTAYRDLYAVKNTSESSANLLQAESLSLTTQIFQANIELREKNLALTSQLLQASMELQKMKTFMAVAGEKLLKTGGRTNFGAEKLE